MYFNNVHILIYTLVTVIGLFVGKFVSWCSIRLPEKKKVFCKEMFAVDDNLINSNYIFMFITAIIYILLLYRFGLDKNDILKNLDLLKFMVLTPFLILTFIIDLKHRIIPNRLTLTIFEFGIIITFLYGITNINMVIEYLLGSVIIVIIFGVITILGRFFSGKEAMGLGDLKFMGAVGLYFGKSEILDVALLGFLIAAICSIVVLIVRLIIGKKDDYISFGPFLSLSCLICMFLQVGMVLDNFLHFCEVISNKLF